MGGSKIVIIDPQNDFTSPEGYYARKHGKISQIVKAKTRINQLLLRHHKSGFIVLTSGYKKDQFAEGVHMCAPGTFGHRIDSDLALNDTYTILTKVEHSGFSSDDFVSYLQSTGTNTLFLCGFLAEYCVKQTALDAIQQGYTVYLIEDCIGTADDVQQRMQDMITVLQSKGAIVLQSNSLPLTT